MASSVQDLSLDVNNKNDHLSKLPVELLLLIGSFLDRSSLKNITKTSRLYHDLMSDFSLWDPFWLPRLNQFFPYTVLQKNKIEQQFKDSTQLMINGGRNKGLTLADANTHCKSNFEIVLRSVEKDGLALQYAKADLNKNHQISLAAIKQNPLAWQYVDESLKNNLDFNIDAINSNPLVFKQIKLDFRHNRQVALIAVRSNGLLLKDAIKFINDRQMVIEAIRQNPLALQYAGEEFKADLTLLAISACNNNEVRFEKCDLLLEPEVI